MADSCRESRGSSCSVDVEQQKPVDRSKRCPMLIRVFLSKGRHHSLAHYEDIRNLDCELHLYTWMDATLHELYTSMSGSMPDVGRRGTHLVFARVFPDEREDAAPGSYAMTEMGVVCCGAGGLDDGKTLADAGFCPGDYIDVAVLPRRRSRY